MKVLYLKVRGARGRCRTKISRRVVREGFIQRKGRELTPVNVARYNFKEFVNKTFETQIENIFQIVLTAATGLYLFPMVDQLSRVSSQYSGARNG